MKLNTFTDYSLRVLIFLALKEDELSTVSEIAYKYEISQNHLVKVVHNLVQLGFVTSKKGRGGGLLLAKKPSLISIGKLVKQLEEGTFVVECFNEENGSCKINPACKLKGALAKAKRSFYQVLDEYTLDDITTNGRTLKEMLSI
ncbi:MAG: Rrf2 family transcriptional regulator [Oligoflexia bacterium]|nr:Rrf2 family transcriptional regulator [Oligoflexia bacterium]